MYHRIKYLRQLRIQQPLYQNYKLVYLFNSILFQGQYLAILLRFCYRQLKYNAYFCKIKFDFYEMSKMRGRKLLNRLFLS